MLFSLGIGYIELLDRISMAPENLRKWKINLTTSKRQTLDFLQLTKEKIQGLEKQHTHWLKLSFNYLFS